MDERYNYYYQGSGLWRTLRDGDFDEADVWDTIKDTRDNNNSNYDFPNFNEANHHVSSKHVPSAAKMIPRGSSSSSSSSTASEPKRIYQKSAPVNVPNWSRLQRQNSKKISKNNARSRWHDDHDGGGGDDGDGDDDDEGVVNSDDDDDDEDEDGECGMRLPPHEYLAMRLARSQISSFSVFEGAGRTLKGRDLSKMRNAVLIKTGFLESP